MAKQYRFIPRLGQRVKLKLWDSYAILGLKPHEMLHVIGYDRAGEKHKDRVMAVRCSREPEPVRKIEGTLVVEGDQAVVVPIPREFLNISVPLDMIEPPIGWQERYTIYCSPEKLDMVLGWLTTTGVSVRQSHDLSCAGRVSYQPLKSDGGPDGPSHWMFPEVTDVVPVSECLDRIKVVKLETVWDIGVPSPCRYCNGTGVHTTNPALEEQDKGTDRCGACGRHLGFSFKEEWHSWPRRAYSIEPLPASEITLEQCQTEKPMKPGECWCCKGSGKGRKGIGEFKRGKERNAALKELEAQGWEVKYHRGGEDGGSWVGKRETVVKEWGKEAGEIR